MPTTEVMVMGFGRPFGTWGASRRDSMIPSHRIHSLAFIIYSSSNYTNFFLKRKINPKVSGLFDLSGACLPAVSHDHLKDQARFVLRPSSIVFVLRHSLSPHPLTLKGAIQRFRKSFSLFVIRQSKIPCPTKCPTPFPPFVLPDYLLFRFLQM